jgi:pSer/pThr/pTyr-binding forkhead associated (FHA) protein
MEVRLMEVRLVVVTGEHQGREIPLPETIFLIGRDDQCHLRPHCPRVSRKHCAIATWAGKVRVRDLQSRNGTYLNGQRVQGEVGVQDGDQLRLGSQVFAFQIKYVPGSVIAAPIRDEGEVDWLLRASEDVQSLAPAQATNDMPLEADLSLGLEFAREGLSGCDTQTADTPAQDGHRTGVSAGHHLRQYFAQRKRSP